MKRIVRGNRSLRVAWGSSVVGPLFAAATARGLCCLAFSTKARGFAQLRLRVGTVAPGFPDARLQRTIQKIARSLDGNRPWPRLRLDLQGTLFQKRVWRELGRIPRGQVRSYGEVARRIGAPRAVRAVGSACARNPIALLIPCHRVVAANGASGDYAWGTRLKRRLLAGEGVRLKG